MKKNRGITMVALVITIVVLLIIAGISIGAGNNAIKNSKLENLKTNMLLIEVKAKEQIENAKFRLGTSFDKATEEEKTNRVNTAKSEFTGEEIVKELKERGFDCDLCQLENGLSRINVKMKGAKETEINGSGPDIPQEKLDELFEKLDHLKENDTLVLAGSIPSSLPDDIYEQIMKKLDQQGIKIIVDATNDLLKKVLPYHPFLIKPNHRELEELFNVKIENKEDLIHYARKLQEQGAINVLVSLGKDGAILVSEDTHVYYCAGAKGKLLNSVGSGDSMVAGFIAGYLKDKKYDEALKLGSACGGATAFSEDLAEASMIQEVYKQLQVEEL